jgi:ribosomal subunit interface protein
MLPTNTLKSFVEPRLSKYEQLVADNTTVKATYELVHNDFIVKLTLLARNRAELVAVETDPNIYVALDKALVKIERQLLKQKEKQSKRIRSKVHKTFMLDYTEAEDVKEVAGF